MKKFVARSAVFFNGDFFNIVTQSTGMLAYAEPEAPPHYLQHDVDDATLGKTMRIALAASRYVELEEFQRLWNSGVIDQYEADREAWMMKRYGYKTKRAMLRKMDCCWICVHEGQIEIKPTHHKTLDGYSGISNEGPEIQHLPNTATDAEVGAAIREGFRRCTGSVK